MAGMLDADVVVCRAGRSGSRLPWIWLVAADA